MSRDEITKLLALAMSAYPNTKNIDAKALVSVWEMAFGDDPAERVYKAMRFHINTCKFFPTVADIMKVMARAEIAYSASDCAVLRLKPKDNQIALPAQKDITDDDLEEFCKWIGFGYPTDIDY